VYQQVDNTLSNNSEKFINDVKQPGGQ
jgi:hypothetical protein